MNIRIIVLFAFCIFFTVSYGLGSPALAEQAGTPAQDAFIGHSGVVLNVEQADSYTYIELDEGDKVVWIAGPALQITKGDKIRTSTGSEMRDFYSKTFSKTFSTIFFVGRIEVEKAITPPSTEEKSITINAAKNAPSPSANEVLPAPDVYNLATVFNFRKKLNGKPIKVRGKIVKSSGSVMGRYWYHIQDGTDMGPHNADLVMTSANEFEAGDVVEAVGMLILDRDFGSGYKYPIILENAEIKVIREKE